MKKNILWLGAAVITASMLSACGANAASATTTVTESETVQEAAESAEADKIEGESPETEVTEEENGQDGEQNLSDEPSVEIYNNGGHFVKTNDKVYFRMPTIEQLEKTALWGEYVDAKLGGSSDLLSFDLQTGEMNTVLSDNGSGSIFISGDYLYMQDLNENSNSYVYRVRMDGSGKESFDELSVCAVKDDFVIMSGYDKVNNGSAIHVYKDGEIVDAVTTLEYTDANGNVVSNDKIVEYVGLADHFIIYKTLTDTDAGLVYSLWSHDLEDKSERYLGAIPDYDDTLGAGYGMIKQFDYENGWFYLGLSYYAGTGNIYYGSKYISADPSTAESLGEYPLVRAEVAVEENTDVTEENAEGEAAEPEMETDYVAFIVDGGQFKAVEGMPGSVDVDSISGQLCYFNENGSSVGLADDYSTVNDEQAGTMKSMELGEYVDEDIFVIWNHNIHVPEEDIGWRMAYKRTAAKIYRVDTTTGEESEIMVVGAVLE